jgi:hypothetical protein
MEAGEKQDSEDIDKQLTPTPQSLQALNWCCVGPVEYTSLVDIDYHLLPMAISMADGHGAANGHLQ